MQLTLFEKPLMSQADIEFNLEHTRKELSNVRRGLFRRYGEIEEEVFELRKELNALREILGLAEVENGKFSRSETNVE